MTKNQYDLDAERFLTMTNTNIKIEFLRHGPHFIGETDGRDIYKITLSRHPRSYFFEFGQSLVYSGRARLCAGYCPHIKGESRECFQACQRRKYNPPCLICNTLEDAEIAMNHRRHGRIYKNMKHKAPGAYDVLAGLTTHDPGTHAEFCSDYGYDLDSIKGKTIYEAVRDEYLNLARLYNDHELEQLAEIN